MRKDVDRLREEPLAGGFGNASVIRIGDTVRRGAGPWSATVHAWLRHLSGAVTRMAPEPVEFDPVSQTELVSYIPGVVPILAESPPYLWRDHTLTAIARLIRCFHDASTTFHAAPEAVWRPDVAFPGGGEVICHNDLAPWNTVFRSEKPVAFIDWDLAAPGPRLWDVTHALWRFVPLYGDAGADPFDHNTFEPRARRARLFLDAYGVTDRSGVVTMLIDRQGAAHRNIKSHAEQGHSGYQRLWQLGAGDAIVRQIEYVQRHRGRLEEALR